MNINYRSIYNHVLGAWVAVSEHSRARGKKAGVSTTLMLALATAGAPAAAQSVLYWDGNGATAGAGSAPSGTWSTGSSGWSAAPAGDSPTIVAWTDGASAVFAAGSDASASYTVTLGGNVTAAGLTYQSGAPGSVLTLAPGGALNLAGPAMPEVNVAAAGSTLRVQAPLAGAAGLRKTGAGTLALTAPNAYLGGTLVEGGVLEVATDAQLGDPSGGIGLNNGATLRLGADDFGSGRSLALGGTGGVIDVNGKRNGWFIGTISGSGALALVNTGAYEPTEALRIALTGPNEYSGGTRVGIQGVNGGRVNARATGSSSLGSGPVDIYFNSEMMFSGGDASADGLTITTHESSNTLGTNSGVYFVGGANAGSARLVNQSKGSYVIFEGANTSAASAKIDNNSGRVYFFGASSGGNAIINNSAGGTVDVVGGADLSGTTIHNSAGQVFVSNASPGVAIGSLDGGGQVILGANRLTLGTMGRDDTIGGNIADTGVGYLDAFGGVYVTPATGVGGSLVKEGAGTLTLAGNNSYTGSTTVNGGTLRIEGNQSMASGAYTVNAGGTLSSSASGLVVSAIDVQSGGTLAGSGNMTGPVTIASGGRLAPGNSPGTLSLGSLALSSGSILDYELGQAGTPGGPSNDLVNVAGNLTLAGTLNVAAPAGGSFGPGLYRLMNYGGTLTDNGLAFGTVPGSAADLYVQTSVAQQVNLVNRAGLTLNFWDGGNPAGINNGAVDGGSGVMHLAPSDRWTDASGAMNAPWTPNAFAIFQGAPGTVTVSNADGAVTFSGAQFAVDGYTVTGDALTTDNANTIIRVGDGTAAGAGYTATIGAAIAGSGELVKQELGTLVLAGANSYGGGTRLEAGTLIANHDQALGTGALTISGGTLGSQTNAQLGNNVVVAGDFAVAPAGSGTPSLTLNGDVNLATAARITQVSDGTVAFAGAIGGANGLTLDATAALSRFLFSGSQANAYTGPTTVQGQALLELARTGGALAVPGDLTVAGQGVVTLQQNEQIADSATLVLTSSGRGGADALQFGAAGLTETIGTLQGSGNVGLAGSTLAVGAGDFSGQIRDNGAAGGGVEKIGAGTLRLSGANSYSGPTRVAAGTLQAGAAQAFSPSSAHSVAAGATLDTGGFHQSVASLANSGTVSLLGSAAGSDLTVRGAYVGNNGTLRLGAVLNANGPSDRLVLDGPAASASGHTHVQITNVGGLGALTTGAGIEVIAARNGASTTAQGAHDAFALAGGHVDAGAFEYQLLAADQNGAGESWYLRSHSTIVPSEEPAPLGVPTQQEQPQKQPQEQPRYRAEVPLFAALPAQLREANAAMLGNLHRRMGDDDVRTPAIGAGERRAWARLIGADLDIRQESTVSPASSGHLEGFQAGTDLFALPASDWRAGIYVGQMDADARVSGLARDGWGRVGTSDLRSQYFGAYATYSAPSGFYVDTVLQYGRHKYGLQPDGNAPVSGRGDGLQVSLELGQSIGLGGGWSIEPQLQLVRQQLNLDDVQLGATQVRNDADNGWLARAGVRVKGQLSTGIGALQPYARVNLYRASSGQDLLRFDTAAASTTISSSASYSSAEVAGGFTLGLTPAVSVYGELGRVFDIGGDTRVKSSVEGSLGLRVRW